MEYQRSENGGNQDKLKFLIKESPKTYIIDASVCIKWFSSRDEDDVVIASSLRTQHMNRNILLAAPDILVYEVVNALAYNPLFDTEKLNMAVKSLYEMGIKFVRPYVEILVESSKLHFSKKITIYDSIYIALAKYINAQYITADEKLFEKVKSIGNVILLRDYNIF
jgi:predicted nucleic acid-binding protein